MKTLGFLIAWALAGVAFTLLTEFRQKKKPEELKPVDGVISILLALLAVMVSFGIVVGYNRLMDYRTGDVVLFIGFVIMGISHLIFKHVLKKY